jgi:hypothetical protein
LDAAIRAKLAADEAGDEYWPNYKDAIEAVLDLHAPGGRSCPTEPVYYLAGAWRPCRTVQAIAEKLGVVPDA